MKNLIITTIGFYLSIMAVKAEHLTIGINVQMKEKMKQSSIKVNKKYKDYFVYMNCYSSNVQEDEMQAQNHIQVERGVVKSFGGKIGLLGQLLLMAIVSTLFGVFNRFRNSDIGKMIKKMNGMRKRFVKWLEFQN